MSTPARSSAATTRVGHLDGLRGVAILAVIGFHFYAHFAHGSPAIYPYGTAWSGFPPFVHGYYGVHLFFAISGFVIALSLERCRTIGEFAVRRFARLWPTMLLCSLLTYAVLSAWPRFWPQAPINFLPSLTFVDAQIWNRLVPHLNANWIDGAYWTLFVEVRFYALAAAVYFLAPKRFMPALAALSVLVVTLRVGLHAAGRNHMAGLLDMGFIAAYLPWFLIGVAALADMQDRRRAAVGLLAIAAALLTMLVIGGDPPLHLAVFIIVAALLFVPGRFEPVARLLSHPALAGIGVASYSLYLLHQRLGLTLISVLAEGAGLAGLPALGVSIVIVVALVASSRLIFRFWETPLNRWIVAVCGFARPRSPGVAASASDTVAGTGGGADAAARFELPARAAAEAT